MIATLAAALICVPLAGGAVTFLSRPLRLAWMISLACVVVEVFLAVWLAGLVEADGPRSAFRGWVYVDSLSALLLCLTALIGFLAILGSRRYVEIEVEEGHLHARDAGHFFPLTLGFLATMVAVPLMNNLGLMWVAIEATTVVSALLVGISRSQTGLEAAWKYLILASVGIALALFGTMMTYYAARGVLGNSNSALQWTDLRAVAQSFDPRVMRLAFVFLLVGYGTKAGLAPMHTWLPDAHSQAPSPVSALLSGVLLNASIYAILRFRGLAMPAIGGDFVDHLLIGFGLFSIAVALPFLTVQGDLKRLFAYSSVEHVGVIVLAVGIGGSVALYAAVLHMVAHSLAKSSAFFSAGAIAQLAGTRRISRLRGLNRSTPILAFALGASVWALGGFPPFAMFASEFGLVAGAFEEGRGVIGVAAALLLALAFAAILFHIIGMAFGESPARLAKTQALGRPDRLILLSALIPVLLGLWLGVTPPGPVKDLIRDAAHVLAV